MQSSYALRQRKTCLPMDYLWLREKSSVAFTTKKILQDIAEVIERLPAFSSEYVIKVDHLVLRRPDRAKTILFQKLFKCFQVSTKICNDVMVMWVFMGAVFLSSSCAKNGLVVLESSRSDRSFRTKFVADQYIVKRNHLACGPPGRFLKCFDHWWQRSYLFNPRVVGLELLPQCSNYRTAKTL